MNNTSVPSLHNKLWSKYEDYLLITVFNNFLNINANIHCRTYFAIKSRIYKLFFKKETKSIGTNCNLDEEDMVKLVFPWID